MKENNLRIIEKHSKEIAEIFIGMLKSAVLYTDNQGIFLLREFRLENNILFYNKIMSHTNNLLYEKLKNSDSIEVIDNNNIRISNKKIGNTGIMVFI